MLVRIRLLAACCALALVFASVEVATATPSAPDTANASGKAKGKAKKTCKKGWKLKTVTKKNGKKAKVCKKKKKGKAKQSPDAGGGGGGGGTAGLFEAPGKQLTGEAAKPFLQKYLLNSSWTSCPAGWPNCTVEERYSHHADNSFYYCRLTSVSGADILVGDEYSVVAAQIEPDGSWIFREVVYNSGNNSVYEWKISTAGVVEGAYQFTPASPIQKLGPFQYVAGPRNCSY